MSYLKQLHKAKRSEDRIRKLALRYGTRYADMKSKHQRRVSKHVNDLRKLYLKLAFA